MNILLEQFGPAAPYWSGSLVAMIAIGFGLIVLRSTRSGTIAEVEAPAPVG